MFSKSDKKWLKGNFATKNDLIVLASKNDIKKLGKKLDKKFTELFNFIDKDLMNHGRRLKKIEDTLNFSSAS